MGGVGVVEWGGDHKWIAELSGIKRKTRRTEGFLRTVGKQAFMDDMAYVPFPFLATVFLQPWVVFVVPMFYRKEECGNSEHDPGICSVIISKKWKPI